MMKWWSKISVKHVVDLHVLAEVSHEHLTLHTNKQLLRTQPFLQAPHREHSNTTQHSNAQQWASPRCSLPTSTADWFETTDKQQKLHGTAIPNSFLSLFFRHTESCKGTKSKSFILASSEQTSRHCPMKTAGEHARIHAHVLHIYTYYSFLHCY